MEMGSKYIRYLRFECGMVRKDQWQWGYVIWGRENVSAESG